MLAFKMMSIVKSALLGACLALVFLIHPAAAPVMSEVVYFASGRVMLIAEHRIDGQNVVLSLKGGGKVFFDADLIDRIEPSVVYGPPPVRADIRTLQRQPLPSKPYAALIQRAAERHDVTANLLHALIEVESGYQPDAESFRGAKGLMQLMPATAERYGVHDPFDPGANIDAGAQHLRELLDRFGMRGGLAAYNAGESPVRKFQGVPPYPETRRYVDRILGLFQASKRQ